MTRFHKISGPIVALALLLSVTASGAAQQSDKEAVEAELVDLVCGIDAWTKVGTSFGIWEWNGTGWEEQTGSSELWLIVYLPAMAHGGCDVSFTFAGLDGPTTSIAPSSFTTLAELEGATETAVDSSGTMFPGYLGGSLNLFVTLDPLPSTTPPGRYDGTYEFSISNAA